MGAESGDWSAWKDTLRPGAGGDDDICCGYCSGLLGGVVDIGYGFGGVVRVVDAGGTTKDDVCALFGGEVGHGGGELVGVYLCCGAGVAHFVIGADR